MTFTVLSSTHADPPSCAPFNDPGCVFGENFENGTYSGWAKNGGDVTIVAGGLNGTGRKTRHFWPGADTGAWIDSGLYLPVTSGQTFWVEWWTQYDANYRWAVGDPAKQGVACANSSHKDFDFRDTSGSRIYLAPEDGTGADCRIANAGGSLGRPRIFLTPDPEPSPTAEGHYFFESPFRLQPGTTYHFILQITSGYKATPFGTSVGAFKMWANGQLIHDRTNVGTCMSTNGACTWNTVLLGGQQAGVGAGGNISYYDQVRVTRTNIAPTTGTAAGTQAAPPTSPSNITFR
jgi:hypothetical protein